MDDSSPLKTRVMGNLFDIPNRHDELATPVWAGGMNRLRRIECDDAALRESDDRALRECAVRKARATLGDSRMWQQLQTYRYSRGRGAVLGALFWSD
ncbi:MAG: hypothetical protein U1F43_29170 [Myxococcota bacterium]